MKVNKNDSICFYSIEDVPRKRFVTPEMKKGAQLLLNKINRSTEYVEDEAGTGFTSHILASVNLSPKVKFIDERILLSPVRNPEKQSGLCRLKIGKNYIQMNSNTGEVVRYNKSFFKTWAKLYQQAEFYLQEFIKSFSDPNVVKKNFVRMEGFTKKGLKTLNETEYYRSL